MSKKRRGECASNWRSPRMRLLTSRVSMKVEGLIEEVVFVMAITVDT
jgi:hypothetical protein